MVLKEMVYFNINFLATFIVHRKYVPMQIYITMLVDVCALEDVPLYLCLFNEKSSLEFFSIYYHSRTFGVRQSSPF